MRSNLCPLGAERKNSSMTRVSRLVYAGARISYCRRTVPRCNRNSTFARFIPAHLPISLAFRVYILSRSGGEGDPICSHFRGFLEPSLGDELGWIWIDLWVQLDCNCLDSHFRHWRDCDSADGQRVGEVSFKRPLTGQIETQSQSPARREIGASSL
jgi:hypothetical protein